MTVVSADQVVVKLRMSGIDSRVEHDKRSNLVWTTGGKESWYLNPIILKSLIKRSLVRLIGTRLETIDIYDLSERFEENSARMNDRP